MIIKKNLLPVLIAVTVFTITGCRDKAYQYVEKAPDSFAQVISEGLTENLKFKNCHTVKSKKYPGSWYAAGELYGGKNERQCCRCLGSLITTTIRAMF